MRRWIFILLLAGCQGAPPIQRSFPATPERVAEAVAAELPDATREGDTFESYWKPDEAVRESFEGFGSILASESRFRVRVVGKDVEVKARSRLFVRRGTRRRDWEEVDPAPAAARLLDRIEARLR
jgi:hypothetical protein